MKLERRLVSVPVEVRVADGKPTVISGYGAVFNTEAVIGGKFREVIQPGAFRNVIATNLDARGTFDHEVVLGRTTNGTLRLKEDSQGLAYEIDANPNDPEAVSVVAKVQRRDVTGSSFGFIVKQGGDVWTRAAEAGGLPLRTITEYEVLRDVGPVAFPAFEDTTAEARSAAALVRDAMPDDDTPEETAEEAACMAACQACADACAACIASCAPLVSDEDSGAICREAVNSCADTLAIMGRVIANMNGQPIYSYFSASDPIKARARLDQEALELFQ